jgi:hypothetical protein
MNTPLPVPPLSPTPTPSTSTAPDEMAYLVDPAQVAAAVESIAAPTEKAAEALKEVGVESVTLITQPSPRLARLTPTKGFPIRHFNGGIVFYPGTPSAEVPLDAWLENQIRRGILKEV